MNFPFKIQLFAGLADRLGCAELNLQLESEQVRISVLKQRIAEQFPEHQALLAISFVAKNQAYASDEQFAHSSDELALLPPVSGGETPPERYRITSEPIHVEAITELVITPAAGATLAFVGTTREWTHGKRTVRLEYEAYIPMAQRMLQQIGEEIEAKWPGALCAIAHRIGVVQLAETSVVIAVSAAHRDACYEASRYAIERLKQIAPIWKKEIWEDGSEWIGQQQGPWKPTEPPHS